MIRNVVVGRLRDGVSPEEIEPGLQALRDLQVEGVEHNRIRRELIAPLSASIERVQFRLP